MAALPIRNPQAVGDEKGQSWAEMVEAAIDGLDYSKERAEVVDHYVAVKGTEDRKNAVAFTQDVHSAYLATFTMLGAKTAILTALLKQAVRRIEDLEVASLPTQTLRYRGVYEDGQRYDCGDFVTFGGSLWHSNGATTDKPGPSAAWTLAVKRGRDGKDAPR